MPLFEGIISDLFPGTKWPNPDYGVLMDALRENCKMRNLQATKWFLKKIIQVCLCTALIKFYCLTDCYNLFLLSIQVIAVVVKMPTQGR